MRSRRCGTSPLSSPQARRVAVAQPHYHDAIGVCSSRLVDDPAPSADNPGCRDSPRGRAAARYECALEEPAPLMVEVLEQFLPMQLKLRAGLIIARHMMMSPLGE